MKNMKFIILIIIGIILFASWVYFHKSKEQKNIQDQWSTLLKSKKAASEITTIKRLTATISKRNGYWEVFGITKGNSKVDIINFEGELNNIQTIEVIFYWEEKKFHGIKWSPLDKENIFEFFRDA